MVDWAHGYDVSVGYTYGFYRELAPDWLDLCTRLAGFIPPRRGPSGQFRYLELGAGQGLGLCLLAAANPQADFVGVDFLPGHVAHAEALAATAGLANVRFVEADFLDLAADWPRDFGTFDYVTLHGIYSWVPTAVRAAVIRCLTHAMRPGSIVYNSYNSKPGALGGIAFQHVSRRLKATTGKSGAAVLDESIRLFDKLIESDAAVFRAIPSLKSRIEQAKKHNPTYLIQEYLNDSWNSFWHSEVAGELAVAKLDYIGTATFAEILLPAALPQPMREIVTAQQDAALRQDLQDLAINQSFRRDIFCRGARRASGEGAMLATRLYLQSPPDPNAVGIATSFGTGKIDPTLVKELTKALGDGPRPIGDLLDLPAMQVKGRAGTMRLLLLLIHARHLCIAADEPREAEPSHRFNALIARHAVEGARYRHLAASKLGAGISAKEIDFLLIESWLASSGKADADALVRAVMELAERSGRVGELDRGPDGKAGRERRVRDAVKAFLDTGLARWRGLGILP